MERRQFLQLAAGATAAALVPITIDASVFEGAPTQILLPPTGPAILHRMVLKGQGLVSLWVNAGGRRVCLWQTYLPPPHVGFAVMEYPLFLTATSVLSVDGGTITAYELSNDAGYLHCQFTDHESPVLQCGTESLRITRVQPPRA